MICKIKYSMAIIGNYNDTETSRGWGLPGYILFKMNYFGNPELVYDMCVLRQPASPTEFIAEILQNLVNHQRAQSELVVVHSW